MKISALAMMLISALSSVHGVAAPLPEVQAHITEGRRHLASGMKDSAKWSFGQANQLAYDKQDVEGLVLLSTIYAQLLEDEEHATTTLEQAFQISMRKAVYDVDMDNSGLDCAGGVDGLARVSASWRDNFEKLPEGRMKRSLLAITTQARNEHAVLVADGCPPVAIMKTFDAVAGKNSLTGDSLVTRGFKDSSVKGEWVPFNFQISGMKTVIAAKIRLLVKPLAPEGLSDGVTLAGARVRSNFQDLPSTDFSWVEIILTQNEAVMAALSAGRLEGLVGPNTAVLAVSIELTGTL